MKLSSILILLSVFFISCTEKLEEKETIAEVDEIKIPSIIKNSSDANFTLKNGILYDAEKPFSGVVKELYHNDTIKTISEYYQGKRQGNFLGYYPDGKKWFERYYKKGIKTGTHKGWFNNGMQMFEYQLNDGGVYDGYIKDWHHNGQLAKHFNFSNGKESGSQKMWKLNGKIRANFYTIKGERHGLIGLKNCVSVITTKNEKQ